MLILNSNTSPGINCAENHRGPTMCQDIQGVGPMAKYLTGKQGCGREFTKAGRMEVSEVEYQQRKEQLLSLDPSSLWGLSRKASQQRKEPLTQGNLCFALDMAPSRALCTPRYLMLRAQCTEVPRSPERQHDVLLPFLTGEKNKCRMVLETAC